MNVIVTRTAALDARSAAVCYRRRDPRPVAGFRERLAEIRRYLAEFPDVGVSIGGTQCRRESMERYRYSVVYYKDSILIAGVLHNRQSI